MKKFCRRPAHNKAIYGITRSLELRGNKADPVPSRIRKLKKAYRESTYRITLNTLDTLDTLNTLNTLNTLKF